MKNLKYFLGIMLIAGIVSFVSCKDNDDDKKPNFEADFPSIAKVDGKITIFVKFETAPCEDVVLVGTHNNWGEELDKWKFIKAREIDGKKWGDEGWWEITVNLTEETKTTFKDEDENEFDAVLAAKPVQLKDGKLDWQFQIGADAVKKDGDVEILPGFPGEIDIYFTSNANVAIVGKSWKNNPCIPMPKHNYKFTVIVPEGTPADADIYVAGGMNEWNPSANKLNKGSGGSYSITINDLSEGTEYKYVMQFEDKTYWENHENRKTGSNANIEDTVESWGGGWGE